MGSASTTRTHPYARPAVLPDEHINCFVDPTYKLTVVVTESVRRPNVASWETYFGKTLVLLNVRSAHQRASASRVSWQEIFSMARLGGGYPDNGLKRRCCWSLLKATRQMHQSILL